MRFAPSDTIAWLTWLAKQLTREGKPTFFLEDMPVSYTHLRAHETVLDLVCRLLLEKKKTNLQDTQRALRSYRLAVA